MANVTRQWLQESDGRGGEQQSYLEVRHTRREFKTREEMDLIEGGYQIDERKANHRSSEDDDNDEDGDEESRESKTASIYISCPYEVCDPYQPVHAMHYSTYTKYIPESIYTISVIVSETCSSYIVGCLNHAHSLFAYLSKQYPDARLELMQSDSSNTAAIYVALTNSDYLVCPPGQGCILPSLFMKRGGRAILASDQTTVTQVVS